MEKRKKGGGTYVKDCSNIRVKLFLNSLRNTELNVLSYSSLYLVDEPNNDFEKSNIEASGSYHTNRCPLPDIFTYYHFRNNPDDL